MTDGRQEGGRGRVWTLVLLGRHLLRQPSFRVVLAGYAALLAWWIVAVPPPHEAVAVDAPWMPWSWARWVVYAWLFLDLRPARGRAAAAHPLEPGRRPWAWSWSTGRRVVEAAVAWGLAELGLLVAAQIDPAQFHVKPELLVVNGLAAVAAVAAQAALRIATARPAPRQVGWIGCVLGSELLLQYAASTFRAAAGLVLVAASAAALLDLNWRRPCSSRS